MSRSGSEGGLRIAVLAAATATLSLAVVFHVVQNGLALTGGDVALSKSVWLGLALLFWIVLPALILCDPGLALQTRRPFLLLLLLMGARALAEPWMLYLFKNWSPSYGIVHDLVCLAVLWGYAVRLHGARVSGQGSATTMSMLLHCFATGALFIPEIYYAWYMQSHFTTHGDHPVYFVPDDGSHRVVLAVTAAVDLLAIAYLGFFLRSWPHGQTQRAGP